jgi:signal transduction histidine kinase
MVLANQALLERLGLSDEREVLGRRPGEAFGCIHAKQSRHGCGTTDFCQYCGAAQVLAECRMSRRGANECRIITELESETEALDLLIWGTPFQLQDQDLILFAVADLTHAKRRQALERIFLHDFANTLGALSGQVDLLASRNLDPESRQLVRRAREITDLLILEIRAHKQLMEAESGSLVTTPITFRAQEVLREVTELAGQMEAAQGKRLVVATEGPDPELTSDITLLMRVLVNLVKNALEASHPGEAVSLGCQAGPSGVTFWVRNQGYMPESVRHQVFKRSYSTKGVGRGLGLYSSRLLVQRYLGGSIAFDSSPDQGTEFRVSLPYALEAVEKA